MNVEFKNGFWYKHTEPGQEKFLIRIEDVDKQICSGWDCKGNVFQNEFVFLSSRLTKYDCDSQQMGTKFFDKFLSYRINQNAFSNKHICDIIQEFYQKFPYFFSKKSIIDFKSNSKKKYMEIGKWYKNENPEHGNWLVYYGENLFGFEGNGNWFYRSIDVSKYKYLDDLKATEATHQEVEKALIEEAKKRYNIGDVIKCFDSIESEVKGTAFIFYNNCLFSNGESFGNSGWFNTYGLIFKDGQWATIIEQGKFAELKEAHSKGAVIESMPKKWIGDWTVATNPIWDCDNYEYRIKPEETPNIGDVVKAWTGDDGQFFVGIYVGITEHKEYKVKLCPLSDYINNYIYAKNIKKLNEKELVNLFFIKNERE